MRCLSIFIILFCCTKVVCAQFSNTNWMSGAYYDTKGVKYKGLLAWKAPDQDAEVSESVIYFKANAKSNEVKIPAHGLLGFVVSQNGSIDIDSFIVSKNPLLSRRPIIEVLVYRNPIKLYRSSSFVMSKAIKWADGRISPPSKVVQFDYYFGPDDQQLTLLDERNFEEVMPTIVSGYAQAMAMIKNKETGFKDILTLLHIYRYNDLPPVSAPAPLKKSGQ